jgi:hypothetical protein
MRSVVHMAASAAAGTLSALLVDPAFGIGLAVAGGFLDIDHIGHYVSAGLPGGPRHLLGGVFRSQQSLERRYGFRRGVPASWRFPVLHCIESAAVPAAAWLLGAGGVAAGAAAGMLFHMLLDLGYYPMSPRFFSMAWRRAVWTDLRRAWEGFEAAGRL